MKKAIIFTLLFTLASITNADKTGGGTLKEAITFSMDYSQSLDSIKAQQACGAPEGKTILEKKATHDFEIMATINNGLMVGEDCASVRYHAPDNISPVEGSIELVVNNYNWEWDDMKIHTFFQTGMTPKNSIEMYIYKYEASGIAAYIGLPEKKEKLFLRFKPKNWQTKSWHHLVLTYSKKEIVLYADGIQRAKGKISSLENWGRYINIGPIGKTFGRSGKSVVRDVTCYNRPLTSKEVKFLAKRSLPDLKLDNSAATTIPDKKPMKSSPWFRERPQLGLKALDDDTVLPPWTPLSYRKGDITAWNRNYKFTGKGILSSITSSSHKLLRSPICINIETTEGNGSLEFSQPKIIKQGAGRVVFERSAIPFNGINAKLRYTVEYDGMIWCELDLSGTDKIKRMTLVTPLTTLPKLVHYVGRMEKSLRSVVAPQFSNSHDLGKQQGILFDRGYCTHIWLGNTDCGMQFFSESEQNWWPKDRSDMIQVVRGNDGNITMNINMVAKALPVKNDATLTYKFGFIATPVKKMPEGWRGMTMSAQYDAFEGDKRGKALVYWPNEWVQLDLDPEPARAEHVDYIRKKVAKDSADNRKIIPYWSRLHFPITEAGINKINPDALMMRDEWSPEPQRTRGGVRDWMRAATSSSWSDYLVWCVDQWAKKFGHIDGVYIDEMELTPNYRAKTGGGYTDLSGKRRPTYSVFADRNLYKRMNYLISQRNNGSLPWSIAHCSGTNMMEVLSPFSIFLVGEHLYSGYFTENPELLPPESDRLYYYSYALPMDRLRAEFYWKQWGTALAWLPCLKNQRDIMNNPIPTRDLLSRIMQADMLIWPLWCNRDEIYKTFKFRQEFDIVNPAVTFIPYWENNSIISGTKGVVVGYYQKGHDYLVLVSNLNRSEETAVLTFKDIPLSSVKNAETMKTIDYSGNQVKLTIPRNDYRALRINY